MATRTDDTFSTTLLTALGGTVNAGDGCRLSKYATNYANGTLANDLLFFILDSGFKGTFAAAAGAALTLVVDQTSTGYFLDQSNATRVELKSTSSADNIYEIRYRAQNGHTLQIATCDVEILRVISDGTVIVNGDADVANVYAGKGRTHLQETAAAGTFPLTLVTAGGTAVVDIDRDVATVNVEGSSVVTFNSTFVTPGTAVNMRGGTLRLKICGTITLLQGDTGTVDQRELTREITITTSALGPGVTIYRSRKTVAPTVTNNNDYGGGPSIITTP